MASASGKKGPREENVGEGEAEPPTKKAAKGKDAAGSGDAGHSMGAASSQGMDTKGRKKRIQKDKGDDQVGVEGIAWAEAMVSLTKLTLANANMIRILVGCVLTTFLVDSSQEYVTAAEEEGKAYDQAVRAAGAGHKHGAPHPHVLMACLDLWLTDQEFQTKKQEQHNLLGQLRRAADDDVQILADPVVYFRIKPTYRGKGLATSQHKLTWAVAPCATMYGAPATPFSATQLQDALCAAVEVGGAVRKRGPPPKAEVERAVERMLARISR